MALACLVWALAPGSSWYDAGELAATAAHLGVPHPTGFPLFNLSGHLFTLLPLGPLALRVHLLGACVAVAACWLWLRLLPSATPHGTARHRPLAWATGAAAVALPLLSPACLQHVRAAEIYPLAWLAVAVAMTIFVRGLPPWRTAALAVLAALALSIHVEAAMIVGLLCALALAEELRNGRWRTVAGALPMTICAGLLALCATAYLPLSAARMPAFSWGDLRSLDAVWGHLSAASIREAYAGRMGVPGWAGASSMFIDQLQSNVGLLYLPAALGVALCWRSNGRGLLATLLVVGADASYSVLINPMGMRDQQVGLLVFLGCGILAVRGLAGITWWLVERGRLSGRLAAPLTTVVLVVMTAQAAGDAAERRPAADLEAGARMADALFTQVPPGALLITSGDHAGSACAWMQAGEGARPDSPCIPGVFLRDGAMLSMLAVRSGEAGMATAAHLAGRGDSPPGAVLAAWLRPAAAQRPVLWEAGLAAEERHLAGHLLAGFPWQTIALKAPDAGQQQRATGAALAAMQAACDDAPSGACRAGAPMANWLGHHAGVLAARSLASGQLGAGPLLRAAIHWAPDQPKVLNNLAVYLIAQGAPAEALAACRRALVVQPDYRRAHRTAARAAVMARQTDAAVAHAAAWLAGGPPSKSQRRWLDGLAQQAGEPTSAARLRSLLTPPSGVGRLGSSEAPWHE